MFQVERKTLILSFVNQKKGIDLDVEPLSFINEGLQSYRTTCLIFFVRKREKESLPRPSEL